MFATVGIGPGLTESLDKLDTASKRGLARAAMGGWAMVEGMLAAGVSNRIINGWLFPPPTLGRQGTVDDDFRGRAVCSIGGIICNDAAEAVYVVAFLDVDGQPAILDRANRYTLRFEKGALPPANEFWSLTMYDPPLTISWTIRSIPIRDPGSHTRHQTGSQWPHDPILAVDFAGRRQKLQLAADA